MINIPSLFLYLDFFTPLFYTFFILLVIFLSLKVLFKELTYKFLVDYLAKNRIYKIKNIKFIDNNLNSIISKSFSIFSFLNIFFNNYLKSLNFNSIVILVMFLFFLIWGFILI